MFQAKFIFLLLAFITIVQSVQKDGKIQLIGIDRFTKMVEKNQYLLAFFTKDDCHFCDYYYPILKQESEMIVTGSPGMTGVPVVKLDMTSQLKKARELGIQGFPTTRFYVNGTFTEYDGEWTNQKLQTWVESRTTHYAGELDEEVYFYHHPEVADVVVLYLHNKPVNVSADTVPFMTEYNQIAKTLLVENQLDMQFSHTGMSDFARQKMDISPEVEFVVWSDRGQNKYEYTGPKEVNPLLKFIKLHSMPLIMDFQQESTIQRIFYYEKNPTLFLINSKQELTEGQSLGLKELSKKYKESLKFVHVPNNNTYQNFNRLVQFLGIENIQLPVAVVLDGKTKYKKQISMNAEQVQNFLEEYYKGMIPAYYKSQPEGEKQNPKEGVVDIVQGNLRKYGKKNNLMVLVYASWCKHCNEALEQFERLANIYKSNIVFGKMDGTKNEIYQIENWDVEEFPALRLYKKDGSIVDFVGEFSDQKLQIFVGENILRQKEKKDL